MDFPGRMMAGFIAVILILIFPLQYIAQLNEEHIDALVDDRTHRFTDDIRQKGYLDKHMYEEYINFLDTTGERYSVEIQDIKPVKGEELSFKHSFERMSYNKIQLFSDHIHNDDCYAGQKHICNGVDCEYEDNAPTEILINVSARRRKSYDVFEYYNYLLISEDKGTTWTKKLNLSGEFFIDQRFTYGPDGYYYFLRPYSSNYEDYYTNVVKYDPKTNDEYVMCRLYGRTTNYKEIIYKNNKFFITPITGSYIMYSTNGQSFSNGTYLGISVTINNIVYGNNVYVAAGREWSSSSGSQVAIYYSSNGIDWNKSQLSASGEANIIFTGDRFIAGLSNGYLYYSYNGINWTSMGRPAVGSYTCSNANKLAYGKNTLINCDGHKIYASTNNGQSYTLTYLNVYNVYYYDGYFYGAGFQTNYDPTNGFKKSVDGFTWTETTVPISYPNDEYLINIRSISFNSNNDTGEIDRGPCLKEGKYYDNNRNELNPICDRVVKSITATHTNQTVEKGGSIITTATATYLDGHTDIVNCTSNFNPNQEGNQTVTLTYTGFVGNAKTTGTRTCTVNVTVKPSRKLISITVLPAEQIIQKYSSPLFSVWANYSDGTNRILNSNEYTVTGFDASKTGTQNVTISYTEAEITENASVSVTVTPLQRECRRCRNIYELNHDDTDPGCPFCKESIVGIEVVPDYIEITQGESLPVQVIVTYRDNSKETVEGWTSNFNPERVGLQIVTVEYGGYAQVITVWVRERFITCPVCYSEYPASESSCPVCAEKVVSITVDPQEITVKQYEPISLTVTAYFANGDSRIVDEWSIDRDTSTSGAYIATVSYKGISTTIKLNVLSVFSTECPVCGLIYDISKSPKGCPVCSEELIGIEAYLLSGTNMVQLGSSPAIAIILIFRDEHREFAYDDYTLEGFNPNELGVQTVKVIYKEFFTTIILEVVNTLDTITCPNGHVYYKNADGTDPGCTFCHSGNGAGKVIYFDITYTSEILNIIYSSGKYNFLKGNYISVIVIKKDRSLLYKAQRMFFNTSLLGRKRRFVYGGVI